LPYHTVKLTFADGRSLHERCALDAEPCGEPVAVVLHHADGSAEGIAARHSYNAQQIGWLRAGSALNAICSGINE